MSQQQHEQLENMAHLQNLAQQQNGEPSGLESMGIHVSLYFTTLKCLACYRFSTLEEVHTRGNLHRMFAAADHHYTTPCLQGSSKRS